MASPSPPGRQRLPPLSDPAARAAEKRAAAEAAAELVEAGMKVGLGTGSTVAHLLPAIAARRLEGLRCAATSPATAAAARDLGLQVEELDALGELDIAIDGADQVAGDGWLIKGGGGAHTREKIVAAAARRFVVIVSEDKLVDRLAAPLPVELLSFGAEQTLKRLAPARLREGITSPDGGLIADRLGEIGEPAELAAQISALPGVIDHGLFAAEMVSLVLVGLPDGSVREIQGAAGSRL